MTKKNEPQPNPKLSRQEKPYQKIVINNMPLSVYGELADRAQGWQQKVPRYCRMVLEHALENKDDYASRITQKYNGNASHNSAINIPIQNKEFMRDLYDWDPFGLETRTKIALSILTKHLEVREW